MGRRVQGPLLEHSADQPVVPNSTRRSARLNESRRRSTRKRSGTDPVYRRRGIRSTSWRVRGGIAALVGGLAASGLWVLGGSTAQAEVVSAGSLTLLPGSAATTDSGVKFADGEGSALFTVPPPTTGGGLYLGLQTRNSANGRYLSKVRIWSDGRVTIGLSKTIKGQEQRFGDVRTNLRITDTTKLRLETSVSGQSPVRLSMRVWVDGQPKPAWQQSVADGTSTRLTSAGSLRTWGYLSSGAAGKMVVPFTGLGLVSSTPGAEKPSTPPITSIPTAPATSAPTPAPTTAKPTPAASAKPAATNSAKPTETKPPVISSPVPSAPADPPPASNGSRPGPDNTGVPAGTELTVHKGDLTITKAGATYDRLDITGFVSVEAPNVTIKRSIIRGGKTNTMRGVINTTNAKVRDFLLVDSEIRVANPSIYLNGINGSDFTLRRVEIDGGVDNAHLHGDNIRIESSWLHSTNFFALGANGDGGPTHNDGIQVMGGNNTELVGNFVEEARNAAIMVTQDVSATTNLSIRDNWLNDGGCTINIVPKKLDRIGPITLTDNVFGGTTRVSDCPVVRTATTTLNASGNTMAGTGQPARINVWN